MEATVPIAGPRGWPEWRPRCAGPRSPGAVDATGGRRTNLHPVTCKRQVTRQSSRIMTAHPHTPPPSTSPSPTTASNLFRPEWRSYCPITRTLDLVGDRWTLIVVRDLLLGCRRFDDFRSQAPEGIATNVLADRLRRLEALGFVSRHRYGSHGKRYEYTLTERGQALAPLVHAIARWGLDNIEGATVHRARHWFETPSTNSVEPAREAPAEHHLPDGGATCER